MFNAVWGLLTIYANYAKKYLTAVICNLRFHFRQILKLLAYYTLFVAKLSYLKNSPDFLPTL